MKKLLARQKSPCKPYSNPPASKQPLLRRIGRGRIVKANSKLWRAATIILLFTVYYLLFTIPVYAACNPPQDYSDCPTARTGPKIAGNTDPDNYLKIRQEYNAVGYTNQWIPTTVIYTVETPYEILKNNLEEMKKNGLLPIIRPWDSTNEENIKRFAGDLNRALNEVGFSRDVIVYAFNEPNLPEGPYRANPQSAAEAISALIQGAGKNPLYKIYLPPIAGHQGGVEETFAQDILKYKMPDGRTIAEAIDGAALTMYQWTIEEFSADLNRWVNLLNKYGVGKIVISELGPYKNGRLLQNLGDIPEWQAKMSEIFRRIKTDPSFLSEASLINTSFFLDINGDGKPDITLLVIIREDGTVEVITIPLEGSIYWPGEGGRQCNPSNSGSPDSRPVPCDACNWTNKLTSSCTTTLTVNDKVSYLWEEADFWCPAENSKPWLERKWGGTITIDPTNTTIPFVGKKGGEDEQKYLADYFEGTDKYYANYQDPIEAMNHLGVFRKLAPLQVQDDLRKQMIYRAIQSKAGRIQEGAIHDYLVEYNGESAKLSEFAGNFPPQDAKERGKWEKETKWGRLWQAVPMFSREDTPGKINPYLGNRPKDTFEILNPLAQVEKVPHLARLYEISQEINKMLLPYSPSAKEKVLGEKTLLAEAPFVKISSLDCSATNWQVNCTIVVDATPGTGHVWVHANGVFLGINATGYGLTYFYTASVQPGTSSFNVNVNVINHNVEPKPEDNASCAIKFDSQGNGTCGTVPLPPPPACGLPNPRQIYSCQKSAITDPNPNDDLCCSPINIALSATDTFENPHFNECAQNPLTCLRTETHDVSRQVGISLLHPYLNQIWNHTTEAFNGFFNIFRPETVPQFADLDAASSLFYRYTPGSASPPGGDFYFPHLGGIQLAKEWVMTALNPLPGGVPWPLRVPPQKLDYTIDFRNPGITINEATKNFVIQTVLASWQNSKIASDWDDVYNQAVLNGWNPAFVIALWIEESGASGVNAYDLGCLGAPRNNLSAQLDCLFSRPYANESFAEFMCLYSEGEHAPCVFKINPHFPGNLKNWYDRLTQ